MNVENLNKYDEHNKQVSLKIYDFKYLKMFFLRKNEKILKVKKGEKKFIS